MAGVYIIPFPPPRGGGIKGHKRVEGDGKGKRKEKGKGKER